MMKFMTFNIREGGEDENGSRIEFIAKVIREASPDFVALQEADGFEGYGDRRLREISERLELPYCALSPGTPRESDTQCHVASLSRYPLKKTFKFPDCAISGGALLTVVDSPTGELAVCNFQLDAYEEDVRLREIEAILEIMSPHERQILLADVNSISRVDNYDEENLQVEPRFDVMAQLSCVYVDVAVRVGLVDRSTHPTPINTHPKFTRPIRIDYALVSRSLADYVAGAAVIKTPASEEASDHYPFVFTLDLE